MATISGNLDTLSGVAGQELLSIYNINSSNQIAANMINASGASTFGSTVGITGQTTFGAQCNYPNNLYTYTNSISGGNTFRFRTTDTSNTAVVNSLANAGVSASTAYTSLFNFYSLGNTENNTTNTESMYIGCTSNGGIIAPSSAGTGVTTKPLNIYGTTMVNNGLVTHPNGLTVTSGNATFTSGTIVSNQITTVAPSNASYTTTLPTAVPTTSGMYLTSTTAGVQSWVAPTYSYYTGDGTSVAPTLISNPLKRYILTQTLSGSSGQATFYLTSTGTSSGTALFTSLSTIIQVILTAHPASASTTATNGVIACEASRTATTVVGDFLVSKSTTISVGGTATGLAAAPSGTICTCDVTGY